jgi:bifunctional UDP-N-acetylglucosamine pyrophosphorylase/glucosamine-1-phosphate N-acetyltransferase
MHPTNVQVIVLAAGKGKRMESDRPKALTPLHGKTFVEHQLDRISKAGFTHKPIVVVGHKKEDVLLALGHEAYPYAVQDEQLGTGHATRMAEHLVPNEVETVIVLFADNPVVRPETIVELAKKRIETKAPVVMATTDIGDWNEWRKDAFWNFGRILRDPKGGVREIVEFKNATEEELQVTEVNPGYLAFEPEWLWKKLVELKNDNAQGEYYLVDLPGMAFNEGFEIPTVPISPIEALGANTKDQLALLEELTKDQF